MRFFRASTCCCSSTPLLRTLPLGVTSTGWPTTSRAARPSNQAVPADISALVDSRPCTRIIGAPRESRRLLRFERQPVHFDEDREIDPGEIERDVVRDRNERTAAIGWKLHVPDVDIQLEFLPVVAVESEVARERAEQSLVQKDGDIEQAGPECPADLDRPDAPADREQQDLGERSLGEVLLDVNEKAVGVDEADVASGAEADGQAPARRLDRVLDVEHARRLVGDKTAFVSLRRGDARVAHPRPALRWPRLALAHGAAREEKGGRSSLHRNLPPLFRGD